jgi:acetylornithine/succinyldiaminopimelate/putrescine aminotransferase
MLPGFKFATFNDLESVKKVVNEATAAVLLETVQCEGGIHPADPEFLRQLRAFTLEKGILLILDEVQTGLGRTGKMWAYEHYRIEPDMMTSAKALGAGLPMGALLVTNQAAQGFQPGDHASTFGGNPIVSAAAIAGIEAIIMKDLAANAAKMGEYLRKSLLEVKLEHPTLFLEGRGLGLVQGLEMSRKAASLVTHCLKQGLLVGSAHETVLRFLPPLIVNENDIDQAIGRLRKAVAEELKTA